MLIFYLILASCGIIFCLTGFIVRIRDGEWGSAAFILFLGVLLGLMLLIDIDAIKRGNVETVEYYFPANHYTFEQIITETNETKYIGSDTVVVVKRDTTYKLVGQDPIVGGTHHFNREYPD